LFCTPQTAIPLQKKPQCRRMAKSFVQSQGSHYPGANLIEAHTSAASDKLPLCVP
jgi:hypothetical protein